MTAILAELSPTKQNPVWRKQPVIFHFYNGKPGFANPVKHHDQPSRHEKR